MTISHWYLTQLFAEDRLTFLDAAQASDLRPADMAVSISSLQEMTPQQVQSYLELFDDRVTGTIYLKQWTSWANPADSITLTFDEYPIPHRWKLVKKSNAAVQIKFTEAVWHTNPQQPGL